VSWAAVRESFAAEVDRWCPLSGRAAQMIQRSAASARVFRQGQLPPMGTAIKASHLRTPLESSGA
jgi:hypothetical protein